MHLLKTYSRCSKTFPTKKI